MARVGRAQNRTGRYGAVRCYMIVECVSICVCVCCDACTERAHTWNATYKVLNIINVHTQTEGTVTGIKHTHSICATRVCVRMCVCACFVMLRRPENRRVCACVYIWVFSSLCCSECKWFVLCARIVFSCCGRCTHACLFVCFGTCSVTVNYAQLFSECHAHATLCGRMYVVFINHLIIGQPQIARCVALFDLDANADCVPSFHFAAPKTDSLQIRIIR